MGLIRSLVYSSILNRVLRGGRGRYPDPYGVAPRYGPRPGLPQPMYPRRRSGGGIFPVPHYSGTTRRGTRFSVGGCCLPIPLTILATSAAATLVSRRSGGGGQ